MARFSRLKVLAVVAVSASVLITAASLGATGSAHPDALTKASTGRGKAGLIGAIYRVGGPATVPAQPPEAGEVSLFTASGRLFARQHVRAGQHFRFTVPPGLYRLNAGWKLHPPRSAPRYDCHPAKVRIRAEHTAHANVGYGCGWK